MLLFTYDCILLMSTNVWSFDENIWIGKILMNGITYIIILNYPCRCHIIRWATQKFGLISHVLWK